VGMKADLILTDGMIFPAKRVDSIAIKGDRILAVARSDEIGALAGEQTETIDLKGRPVLPGFIDAHVHLFDAGLREIGWRVDLSGLSRDETLAALREAVKLRGKGEWVIGEGWDESRWGKTRYLTAEELDRIAPRSPLGALRMDGHMIVLNSAGLRAASAAGLLPDSDPDLFDPEGGILREDLAWALLQRIEPDPSTLAEALSGAARLCHRLGVTSVHTMTKEWRVPILFERRGRDLLRVGVYQTVGSPAEIEGVRERSVVPILGGEGLHRRFDRRGERGGHRSVSLGRKRDSKLRRRGAPPLVLFCGEGRSPGSGPCDR